MRLAGAGAVALATLLLTTTALLPAREQTMRVHYTPRDQEVRRYAYVPVDVPAGTTALTIRYSYDAKDGANAIDLGVFEPGTLALGSKGFRGWSGGSREHVTIGAADATPGYWPGPIQAGTW